jgi:hypothetical protein
MVLSPQSSGEMPPEMNMIRLKEIIRYACFIMSIILTGYIIFEICIIQNSVSVLNIIIRYIGVIIDGLLLEKYVSFFRVYKKIHISKKSIIITWFKYSILYGTFYWGVGTGAFFLIFIILAGGYFTNLSLISHIIISIYGMFLIGGFIFGNILYIVFFNRRTRQG